MMRRFLLAALALAAAGCGSLPPLPAWDPLPAPEPEEVERIVYFIGDTGEVFPARNPAFHVLRADVERWTARLDTGAVTLVVLGDLIYPSGMHDPANPAFPQDSAILEQQIAVVGGPAALARSARAYFLPGNHDYGQETDLRGRLRLTNTQEFIARTRRRTGAQAWLLPGVHEVGPAVVDLGDSLRLVLLDTAWWLLQGDRQERVRMLVRLDAALATAGERAVVVAAHHPFQTAGPHGGFVSLWEALGLRYVLTRSGAILQDLNSIPYRELLRDVEEIFRRRGRPLLFAGGHEHSLQVIRHDAEGAPQWTAVSGSGSKLTAVGRAEGMRFGAERLGYMKLVLRTDGHLDLYAVAMPEDYGHCAEDPAEPEACAARALEAAETVYSVRLR